MLAGVLVPGVMSTIQLGQVQSQIDLNQKSVAEAAIGNSIARSALEAAKKPKPDSPVNLPDGSISLNGQIWVPANQPTASPSASGMLIADARTAAGSKNSWVSITVSGWMSALGLILLGISLWGARKTPLVDHPIRRGLD